MIYFELTKNALSLFSVTGAQSIPIEGSSMDADYKDKIKSALERMPASIKKGRGTLLIDSSFAMAKDVEITCRSSQLDKIVKSNLDQYFAMDTAQVTIRKYVRTIGRVGNETRYLVSIFAVSNKLIRDISVAFEDSGVRLAHIFYKGEAERRLAADLGCLTVVVGQTSTDIVVCTNELTQLHHNTFGLSSIPEDTSRITAAAFKPLINGVDVFIRRLDDKMPVIITAPCDLQDKSKLPLIREQMEHELQKARIELADTGAEALILRYVSVLNELKPEDAKAKVRNKTLSLAFLFLFILGLGLGHCYYIKTEADGLDKRQRELSQTIAGLADSSVVLAEYKNIDAVKTELEEFNSVTRTRNKKIISLLSSITTYFPSESKISQITISSNMFMFTVEVPDMMTAAYLVKQLKNIDAIASIHTEAVSTGASGYALSISGTLLAEEE